MVGRYWGCGPGGRPGPSWGEGRQSENAGQTQLTLAHRPPCSCVAKYFSANEKVQERLQNAQKQGGSVGGL